MREHMGLFHGKRIDNGEWVEGFYYRVTNNWTHENVHYITCFQDMPLTGETILTVQYEVDPDTIGECTGLKEPKSDKLLFEGEAIKYKDRFYGEVIAVIEYDPEGACFCAHTLRNPNSPALDIVMNESEVELLGPLCDNPEFLKGGEGDG